MPVRAWPAPGLLHDEQDQDHAPEYHSGPTHVNTALPGKVTPRCIIIKHIIRVREALQMIKAKFGSTVSNNKVQSSVVVYKTIRYLQFLL